MSFLIFCQRVLRITSRFVATGFFSGLSPVAPGTAGSIVYFIIWLSFFGLSGHCLMWEQALTVLFIITIGWVCTRHYIKFCAATDSKKPEDPSEIVIDEFAGVAISLLAVPCGQPGFGFLALLFFRIFDIWKPGLIRRAEKAGGAPGIMLDDLVAGVFSYGSVKIITLIYFLLQNTPR